MKKLLWMLFSMVAVSLVSCDKFGFGDMGNNTWEMIDGPSATHPTTMAFRDDYVTIEYATSKVYPLQNGKWDYTIWELAGECTLELSRSDFDEYGEEEEESYYLEMSMNNDGDTMTLKYNSLIYSGWKYKFVRI